MPLTRYRDSRKRRWSNLSSPCSTCKSGTWIDKVQERIDTKQTALLMTAAKGVVIQTMRKKCLKPATRIVMLIFLTSIDLQTETQRRSYLITALIWYSTTRIALASNNQARICLITLKAPRSYRKEFSKDSSKESSITVVLIKGAWIKRMLEWP